MQPEDATVRSESSTFALMPEQGGAKAEAGGHGGLTKVDQVTNDAVSFVDFDVGA